MNKVLLFIYFFSLSGMLLEGKKLQNTDFEKGIHLSKEGVSLPVRTLYPQDFRETEKYPLILFLHGAGERGDDNERQLIHGKKLFLEERKRMEFPAVVVFPQCPEEDYWSNVDITNNEETNNREFNFNSRSKPTDAMIGVLSLLDSLIQLPFIDSERVYIGGLSMGGMGTFEVMSRRPNVFAAAIAICGGGDPKSAKKYAKKIPLWIFHGAMDDVVPATHSMQMAKAIQTAGGTPKLTIYPETNHNSWDPTFAEPELLPWLFSQTKKK